MKTEFFESDPFSPRKADLLVAIESDYRFEKGDEVVIDMGGHTTKVRIMAANSCATRLTPFARPGSADQKSTARPFFSQSP